jgi:hypothetical protein
VPVWVSLGILYAASFAIWIVSLGLIGEAASRGVAATLLAIAIVSSEVMVYARQHLMPAAGGFSGGPGLYGPMDDEPLTEGRVADIQERRALKQWRRGRIPRREYERIVATRRFSRGEISRLEFHEILRQLEYGHPGQGEVGSTAEGLP